MQARTIFYSLMIDLGSKNLVWMYFKKRGLVASGDVGLADFAIQERGLDVFLKIRPQVPRPERVDVETPEGEVTQETVVPEVLNLEECRVTIHDLDFKVHDAENQYASC